MKSFFIAVICLISVTQISAKHPTHLSVVNLTYDTVSNEITYSIRLFQDDINYLIAALYHDELFHSTDTFDLNQHTEKLDRYFLNVFELFVGDKKCNTEIVKHNNNEIEFWFYFKGVIPESTNKILIRNRILLDIYGDQTNLVIVSDGLNEKGYSFDLKKQEQYINLVMK